MTSLRFLPAILAASAVLSAAPLASALLAPPGDPATGSCATNADCGRGYECTVVGASSCAPTPACAPGESCPAPMPCDTTEIRACTPAHCEADADCADGMVCHEWTQDVPTSDCACAPDTKCDCGTAEPVVAPTVKLCTPPYVLPCQTSDDCGAGFTCQTTQSCGCSGSGGSADPLPGGSGSGAAPLPPEGAAGASANDVVPPDCGCQPSEDRVCLVTPVTCSSDLDCQMGWSCVFANDASSPACPPGADCSAEKAAPTEPLGGTCQPPYYGATSGVDLQGPKEPGGTPTTTGNGSANGSGENGGTTAPQASNSGDGEAHESSACQIGHAPASRSVFSLLAVLGALFGLSRRRRAQS